MPTHSEPSPRVTFTTTDHNDAARVRAVLEALGFDVVRVVPDDEFDDEDVLARAAAKLRSQYRLREAEFALVWGLLEGLESSALDSVVGRALAPSGAANTPSPLKWVSRSLFAKLGLDNGDRAGLVALVEGLKDQREGTSFAALGEVSLAQARELAGKWAEGTLSPYERAAFYVWVSKRCNKIAPHGTPDQLLAQHFASVFAWETSEGQALLDWLKSAKHTL